jgi:hypothetical protein
MFNQKMARITQMRQHFINLSIIIVIIVLGDNPAWSIAGIQQREVLTH